MFSFVIIFLSVQVPVVEEQSHWVVKMMDFHLGIVSLISTGWVVIGGIKMESQSALFPKLESSYVTMILTFKLKTR